MELIGLFILAFLTTVANSQLGYGLPGAELNPTGSYLPEATGYGPQQFYPTPPLVVYAPSAQPAAQTYPTPAYNLQPQPSYSSQPYGQQPYVPQGNLDPQPYLPQPYQPSATLQPGGPYDSHQPGRNQR